jgi:NADPH2:quinone reductase
MKAIRVHEFGGPDVLKLEEVATPKPSAGEVLVRIHAAGINPYDTYIQFAFCSDNWKLHARA